MSLSNVTTRDGFEYWLASLDDMLEVFLSRLPAEGRARLDFSPESLDVLEAWILTRYSATGAMLVSTERDVVNGLACYIGETYRKAVGGHWDICLDDTKSVFYGLPILVWNDGKPKSECPLTLATASANRRTGKYLRTVLQNLLPKHP